MNKRYKALFKAQISRDPVDWSVYRRLRNDVTKELRMAEANYWSSKLNGTRSGSKGFWNVVKRLTGKSDKFKLIDENKTHGADNLSAREMKLVAEELNPCVANLSRQSYAAGQLSFLFLTKLRNQ